MVKEKFYAVYMKDISKYEVADIMAKSPETPIGRGVKFDLSLLSRGRLGEISGKILEIKNDEVMANPTKVKLYPSYVKRFVRRGVSKIDESYLLETSDGQSMRVKPTLITRKKVKRSIETALRREMKEFLTKLFSGEKVKDIFEGVISGEIQKKLSKKLKKTYPLSFCEIRELSIAKKR